MPSSDSRVIVSPLRAAAKSIVSEARSAFASAIAARRLPAPLLALFITSNVAAGALPPMANASDKAEPAAMPARRRPLLRRPPDGFQRLRERGL